MEKENKQKSVEEAFLDVLFSNLETIGDLQDLTKWVYDFGFSGFVLKYNPARKIKFPKCESVSFAQRLIDSIDNQKSKLQFNKLT